MNRQIILIVIIVCFAFYNSIAQIQFDYDKEVDFDQFKTIQFIGWQDDSDQVLDDLNKERIYEAFRNEFSKKGFKLVKTNGNLLLTFFIVIDEKTSVTAYSNYQGSIGFDGYYRGGWGWNQGFSTTIYSENDYLEGTFVVDFYDEKSKKLIWQGVSTKTISENPKRRAKLIPKRVEKLIKNFPPDNDKND